MSAVWIVARRELRGFFDQATAYVLVVAFLGLALFLTFNSLFAVGSADLRSFFSLMPWLFAVFLPAVTMRSLAEERSRGTLEWLVSQPLTEGSMLLGKFLGCWLFALATVAGTLPMTVGVLVVAGSSPGPIVAQYIGTALLAAQFTAVGMFGSALTRNQITAFILSTTLCFALVLAGLRFTLMALFPDIGTIVASLAVIPHFQNVSRGVVDLRDVLYFVSVAALFLGLAHFLVLRERLSRSRGAFRRLRTGIIVAATAVVFLNLLGSRIHGRLDLTPDRLYTLSPGTLVILEGLEDIVTIKLFASTALPVEIQTTLRDVRDLLADYRRRSNGRVRVEEVHPDEDDQTREEATSAGIQEIQFNVLREDEFEMRSGWLGLSIQYADERKTVPLVSRTDDLEYRLTSAISAMTTERERTVIFLTGFGARSGFELPELEEMLRDRYAVRASDVSGDTVPALSTDSIDLVVLVGPTEPLGADAVAAIDTYLDKGGAGLFLLEASTIDPQTPFALPVSTGLEDILRKRGVWPSQEMAYDLRSNQTVSMGGRSIFSVFVPYPLWPVALPARAGNRPTMTADLEALSLAWATPLDYTDSTRVQPLWTTSEYGGRQPARSSIDPQTPIEPDPSELGVQVLAAEVGPAPESSDEGAGGRLVVVGDADFIDSRYVQGNPQNVVFVANAVDWLAQDESLIEIRSKDRTPRPLVFESEIGPTLLRWGNQAGMPLLFVAFGLLRAVARRRRAETLAREVEALRGGGP